MNEENLQDRKLQQAPQHEPPKLIRLTDCLKLSLVSLGIMALCFVAGSLQFAPDYLLLFMLAALVAGVIAALDFLWELLVLVFRKRAPRPSPLRMILAIPVWLLAAFLFFMNFALFLGKSVRSPVACVKSGQRTLSYALEEYYLDHNAYPAWSLDRAQNAHGLALPDTHHALQKIPTFRLSGRSGLATLTTPTSYISSYSSDPLFSDPFAPVKGVTFAYWNPANEPITHGTGFLLWSPGPDGDYDVTIDNVARIYDPTRAVPNPEMVGLTYDPSNGAKSNGDIYRYKQ